MLDKCSTAELPPQLTLGLFVLFIISYYSNVDLLWFSLLACLDYVLPYRNLSNNTGLILNQLTDHRQ